MRDTNDNPPRFSARRYRGSVPAGAIPGTLLTLTPEVRVSDPDEVSSQMQFRLAGCGEVFSVSALALVSVGERGFDRERYECGLEVRDEDGMGDNSSLEVEVLGWGAPVGAAEENGGPTEKTSALTDRSIAGTPDGNDPDQSQASSSHFSNLQNITERDPLQLDDIVERQDFRSRALTESSQVLTQLLGSSSELNATSVLRATARIPSGLPVDSAIYQLPSSILSRLAFRNRKGFNGLIEMWPQDDITKSKPSNLDSSQSFNSEERHFAVELYPDGGVVVLARPLTSPGQVVLRLQVNDEETPRDILALLVDIVPVPQPRLRQDEVTITLDEGEYTDEMVGVLQLAESPDDQKSVKFSIADSNTAYRVSQDGTVFISGDLDFEYQRQISVNVLVCPQLCTDLASALPLRGTVRDACQQTCAEGVIKIKLRDINDNPPKFLFVSEIVTAKRGFQNEPDPPYALYKLHTPEVLEEGIVVVNMSMYDADGDESGNGEVKFQLVTPDDDFTLDGETGQLRTAQQMSHIPGDMRRLVVAAYDKDEPSLRSMAILELAVADVDSIKSARAFDKQVYTIEVPENSVVARLPVPWKLTASAPPAPNRWLIRQVEGSVAGLSANVDKETLELSGAIDFEKQRELWLIVTLETGLENDNISSPKPPLSYSSDSVSEPGFRMARRLASLKAPSFPLPDSPLKPEDSLLYNQALLRVAVTDVNDNRPRWNVSRLGSIAGVPYDAGYGFNVLKLQVGPCLERGECARWHVRRKRDWLVFQHD